MINLISIQDSLSEFTIIITQVNKNYNLEFLLEN